MEHESKQKNGKIFTIPNLLSLFRLCLIPLIVWLYVCKENDLWTFIALLISGATDIIDGFIARKFDMVSDIGKALDPFADKLTQLAMLFCLLTRFHYMLILICLLIVKEILAIVINTLTIRKTGVVMCSEWHGKATTVAIYTNIVLHLIWVNIPFPVSISLLVVCTLIMLISSFLYSSKYIQILTCKSNKNT